MKKLDLNDIEVIFPENLNQLLIWTSELAQHNHTQFIKFSNKLKLVAEEQIEQRTTLTKKIKF